MRHASRYACVVTAVAIATLSSLAHYTHGFTSYTYEGLRRAGVLERPVDIGNWALQDSSGRSVGLHEYDEPLLLIDFIFTRCPTVCRALGSQYRQLAQQIADKNMPGIRLLSVSIDPQFDTPQRLAGYKNAHAPNAHQWTVARPISADGLATLTRQTGLQVIADPLWGFSHSDAIHIVRDHQLIAIVNADSIRLDTLLPAAPSRL